MNLQDERIQMACDTLTLGAVAEHYPALAQQAVEEDASYVDFLERCLKAEQDELLRGSPDRGINSIPRHLSLPSRDTAERMTSPQSSYTLSP